MGLLSAGLTAFYVRDSSLLPSMSDLPPIPRFPNPRALVSGSTVFFGAICLIVVLILAYVTNPSESSFRTFLTEQAFRRHLHKLQDEDAYGDEESLEYDAPNSLNRIIKGRPYGLPRRKAIKPPTKPSITSLSDLPLNPHARNPRFHFANHLGIALQTPSHVFRSYGLCTIAVTQQVDTASPYTCLNSNRSRRGSNGHVSGMHAQNGRGISNHPGHCETGGSQDSRIRGTWYIGAFGKWWIGGDLAFLKEDLMQSAASATSTPVDEEADKVQSQPHGELKSGKYEVKVLDQVNAFSGLPSKLDIPSASSGSSHPTAGPSTSSGAIKSRSRAASRSVKQTATPLPSRSSTPPPAHARTQVTIITPNGHKVNGTVTGTPSHKQDSSSRKSKSRSNSNANATKSPVAAEETSHPPDVVRMLQEIAKSQAAVQELRDQLSSFQQQAFSSHAALRLTLDEHRTKKKQEDVTRTDLKSRMKALEESKRHADTGKREAEKKVKSAQTARDSTTNRMQRLSAETENMKKRMETGEERVIKSKEEVEKVDEECNDEMEKKKVEAKTLEENIGTLTTKTKELEETLATEKELLTTLKKEVEEKKQLYQQHQQAALTLAIHMQQRPMNGGFGSMEDVGLGGMGMDQQQQNWAGSIPVQNHTHNIGPAILPTFNHFDQPNPYALHPRRPSAELAPLADNISSAISTQSRLRSVSLGELSSLAQPALGPLKIEPQQLSPGDEGFSPFEVDDRNQLMRLRGIPSYSSINVSTAGLLPSGLVNSMETGSSLSILSPPTNGTARESRWRPGMWPFKSDLSKSTPASSSSGGKGFDPFDSQRPSPVTSVNAPEGETTSLPDAVKPSLPGARRWFSRSTTTSTNGLAPEVEQAPPQVISAPEGSTAASKSRLNPDAKVFSLPRGRNLLSNALWTPTGMAMPPPLNVRPGPLHLLTPPPDDFTSSLSSTSSIPVPTPASTGASTATGAPASKLRFRGLFSSPFAPSPAEREALQRALEKNLSHDRISVASDGSGEGSSLRLPPSPFGLPPPNASLFDVDEEESDAGWGSVLKSAPAKKDSFGESMARQTTR